MGVIPPTGKKMDASCCDVFQPKNGKVQTFSCYPSATVMLAQLGVLPNVQASLHGGTPRPPHDAFRLRDCPSNLSRAARIVGQCVCSQVTSPRTGCMNCLPSGVRAYSTRGGTSA